MWDWNNLDLFGVTNLYREPDNAYCFHGNHSAEALYILCKQKIIKLLSYDYNKSCCGKDQFDHESAAAKIIIRSFIDSSNVFLDGDDPFKALYEGWKIGYGYGMKGSIDSSRCHTVITGEKISNISNYHSIQFHTDQKIMWHYFGIRLGIKQKYSSIVNIKTSA